MRRYGLAVFSISLVALIVAIVAWAPVGAARQTAGTPSAATPAASPAATAAGETDVITLVAWYSQDPSGNFLDIGPLSIDQNSVARQATSGNGLTGKADFSGGPNGEPEITLGDSTFDGVLTNPDDPDSMFRWLYYNDEQGGRPATLVFQVQVTAGPYKGYVGTATFASRTSTAGGVLVIMVKPAS